MPGAQLIWPSTRPTQRGKGGLKGGQKVRPKVYIVVCHCGHNVAGRQWHCEFRGASAQAIHKGTQRSCVKGDCCCWRRLRRPAPLRAPPSFHSWLSAGSCFPLQSSAERALVRSIPTRLYTAPHHTHSTYTHLGPKQRSAFRELRFFQLSPTMCFAEWSACRCHRLLAR